MKIEVSLYEVPYIISYAEFSGESISGIINAKSGSIWSIFKFFFPSYVIAIEKIFVEMALQDIILCV